MFIELFHVKWILKVLCNPRCVFIMYRYFIELSYIGTRFRGVQKNIKKVNGTTFVDVNTVQGRLDNALQIFKPINEIKTVLSSRTDAGVHALHTAVHVDLQRVNCEPYEVSGMLGVLNRTLYNESLPIRILNVRIVPDTFHCRFNALGRTYLYRFAVAKNGTNDTASLKNRNFQSFLPVEELDRCFFMQNSMFDIERLKNASRVFLGRHDFRTFMSGMRGDRDHPMFTIRKIDEINIKRGKSSAVGESGERANSLYNYWEIEFKGRSFLYKQVRRMLGALFGVATNLITEKQIYQMLTVPSKHNWEPRLLVSPAYGLYLCKVHYNEADFGTISNEQSVEGGTQDTTKVT